MLQGIVLLGLEVELLAAVLLELGTVLFRLGVVPFGSSAPRIRNSAHHHPFVTLALQIIFRFHLNGAKLPAICSTLVVWACSDSCLWFDSQLGVLFFFSFLYAIFLKFFVVMNSCISK